MGHAAFRGNAVDACVAPRCGNPRCIARRIVVMHQPEIDLGLGMPAP